MKEQELSQVRLLSIDFATLSKWIRKMFLSQWGENRKSNFSAVKATTKWKMYTRCTAKSAMQQLIENWNHKAIAFCFFSVEKYMEKSRNFLSIIAQAIKITCPIILSKLSLILRVFYLFLVASSLPTLPHTVRRVTFLMHRNRTIQLTYVW